LSNISFVNTDITKVKFSEDAIWGTPKDPFKIQSERILEKSIREQDGKGYKKDTNLVIAGIENINLAMAGIENLNELLTMYRNLRENYEFRMKYDEAGQFFVREMEVKRKYRQGKSGILKNNWVRRNFSLTGIYHVLSNYGEDYRIPILWLLSLSVLITISSVYLKSGPLTGDSLTRLGQSAQITISDLLQMNSNPGFLDYIMRIISIPILGLVFISLRRKFERKFRH
jgi:hypothetical protein